MAGAYISRTGRRGLGAAKPRRDVERARADEDGAPRRPGTCRLRSLLMIAARSSRCSRAARPEAKDGCWAV
jgi:hypothetical protein